MIVNGRFLNVSYIFLLLKILYSNTYITHFDHFSRFWWKNSSKSLETHSVHEVWSWKMVKIDLVIECKYQNDSVSSI